MSSARDWFLFSRLGFELCFCGKLGSGPIASDLSLGLAWDKIIVRKHQLWKEHSWWNLWQNCRTWDCVTGSLHSGRRVHAVRGVLYRRSTSNSYLKPDTTKSSTEVVLWCLTMCTFRSLHKDYPKLFMHRVIAIYRYVYGHFGKEAALFLWVWWRQG